MGTGSLLSRLAVRGAVWLTSFEVGHTGAARKRESKTMTKQKKVHVADQIDTAAISGARQFQATLFLGTGKFEKAEAANLPAIRTKAAEMEKAAGNGRKAMIHAMIDGKAVPVPHNFGRGVAPKAAPAPKVAAAKAKAAKITGPKAKAAKAAPRKGVGSKTDKVIAMLRKGSTRAAIVEATGGWQVDLKQLAARKGLKLTKNKDGVITATGGKAAT